MTPSFVRRMRRFCAVVALAAAPCLGCSGPETEDSSSAGASTGAPEAEAVSAPAAVDMATDVDLPRRGMMTYMADAPRFTDCATGASFVMAQEAGYLAAEQAYLGTLSQGEPLLVTFSGYVARRPGMEGGEVDAIVVTSFQGAHPGEGCGPEPVVARLEGTEWRLVALPGGVDVPSDAGATLFLDPDLRQATGSTGCNLFTASYALEGGRLTLGLAAVTRRACPEPLDAVEADLLEALRVTGGYRFAGGFLELLGEAGAVARLADPGT